MHSMQRQTSERANLCEGRGWRVGIQGVGVRGKNCFEWLSFWQLSKTHFVSLPLPYHCISPVKRLLCINKLMHPSFVSISAMKLLAPLTDRELNRSTEIMFYHPMHSSAQTRTKADIFFLNLKWIQKSINWLYLCCIKVLCTSLPQIANQKLD